MKILIILISLVLMMSLACSVFAMSDNEIAYYIGRYVEIDLEFPTYIYTYEGLIIEVKDGIVEIETTCCGRIRLGTCWVVEIREISK